MANTYLLYTFGAMAFVMALVGLLQRTRRSVLWPGALCAAGAAWAAHADSFWPMTTLALLALWAAFSALPMYDFNWRARTGLVVVSGILTFVTLWPSLAVMSDGKIPCPQWAKDRIGARLVAGLDLRGGLRLVYTVDVDAAIKDKRDRYYEDMRRELARLYAGHQGEEAPTEETLKKLREKVDLVAPRSATNVIDLKIKEGADPAQIDARFRDLFKPDIQAKVIDPRTFQFSVRETAETAIRERAVSQAKDIILRRVDDLGLREAAVSTRDEDIIVEVPGSDEAAFETIRDIISQTARLDFKLLDDDTDVFAELERTATPDSLPEGLEFRRETVPVGLDASGDRQTRVNTYAVLNRKDGETTQDALQRLKEWISTLTLPPDREVGYELEYKIPEDTTLKAEESGYRTFLLKSRAEITGDMIRDAAAQPDQSTQSLGGWHVALTFTDQGGRLFEKITAANVKRRFAIILDGRVESAPEIIDRIAGGHASITMGSHDPEVQLRDARKLELVLRSGALPAPISPSNEQRIGPSLGSDSIALGLKGAAAGSVLVLLFMIFYYHRAGLIADIAVIMNLFMQLAVLAGFGASMTLPGIAGLALTVGMSVDANVLINERIRDELREGKSPRTAVEIGYDKAFSAIVDGHITTLISGIVLAQYGTGPIKGFAVTLMVGVVCSIFTGVFVSRVLFDLWVRGSGKKAINLG